MNRKNTILISVAIIAITLFSIGMMLVNANANANTQKFVTYNFSDSCSVELPSNIKFTDKIGDMNSNGNTNGFNVNIESKSLFGNSAVQQITYTKNTINGASAGVDLNDAGSTSLGGRTVYHRSVMNEETGESVTIMGDNKELVDYIADHVKFNGKNSTNKTVNTNTESVNTDNVESQSQNNNQQINNQENNKNTNSWTDANGFNHYIDENGAEMVGSPDKQHMSVEEHEHISKYGMA